MPPTLNRSSFTADAAGAFSAFGLAVSLDGGAASAVGTSYATPSS